jgi:transcriptional regulator with XRE-family HTH domain
MVWQVSESLPVSFGHLLRSLRTTAGLTQEELAETARVSYRSISDLERGVNRSARRDTAQLLADALGLSGDDRARFEAAARGHPPETGDTGADESPAEAEIVIYLDEYDDAQLHQIQAAATRIAAELGYADFALINELVGSIFLLLRGKLKAGLKSATAQQLKRELEDRVSIEVSGRARAEADAIKTSSAVQLIASLAGIPNAVVRVGGLLIVKQTGADGIPAVMMRDLSSLEIRALELNPGIQRDPQGVLQLLAAAVAQLREDGQGNA